jgi:hypothetical protein
MKEPGGGMSTWLKDPWEGNYGQRIIPSPEEVKFAVS